MTTIEPLSPTYAEARTAFLDAAASSDARVATHPHPHVGPDGGPLAVDVAELGAADARRVVLVVSGTHGVEGYCGSALQRHWLAHHRADRPDDVAVVMIHAFNPVGFAWVRRVNEDNVDLNRNFIDWTAPVPDNADYDRIARLLVPVEWSEADQERTTAALFELVGEVGLDRAQAIISGGQYRDPTGVFYGGQGPVWSNRWIGDWAGTRLAGLERLAVIDLHTGLGPWGHGELIGHEPIGSDQHRRATEWWGEVIPMGDERSVSAALTGDWLGALHDLAPGAEITAAALEFGTVDPISVLQALRADAWLHAHGDPRAPAAAAVRAQVRAAFADDDPAWIAMVWERFAQVMADALRHIAA